MGTAGPAGGLRAGPPTTSASLSRPGPAGRDVASAFRAPTPPPPHAGGAGNRNPGGRARAPPRVQADPGTARRQAEGLEASQSLARGPSARTPGPRETKEPLPRSRRRRPSGKPRVDDGAERRPADLPTPKVGVKGKKDKQTSRERLLAVDHSARASMKNAASCEN